MAVRHIPRNGVDGRSYCGLAVIVPPNAEVPGVAVCKRCQTHKDAADATAGILAESGQATPDVSTWAAPQDSTVPEWRRGLPTLRPPHKGQQLWLRVQAAVERGDWEDAIEACRLMVEHETGWPVTVMYPKRPVEPARYRPSALVADALFDWATGTGPHTAAEATYMLRRLVELDSGITDPDQLDEWISKELQEIRANLG